MENTLPKHLGITLDNFLNDSVLTSWSVQSNSKVASITIRFRVDTDQDQGHELLDSNTKYKRMPESQQKRDMCRAKLWKDKSHTLKESVDTENDILLSKQGTEVPSCHVEDTANPPTVSSACAPVSARTRSRLESSATAPQPILSPVGQVDGPSDRRPQQLSNPQAVGKDRESPLEWEKAMTTFLTERLSKLSADADDFG